MVDIEILCRMMYNLSSGKIFLYIVIGGKRCMIAINMMLFMVDSH